MVDQQDTQAPDDGDSGKAATPEPTPDTPPAPDSAAAPTEQDDTAPDKTFSQAEVDKLIKERLGRERKKNADKYADYGDLKNKAVAFDEAERSKLDEVERLQLELKEAQDAASSAVAEAQTQAIATAVMSEAAKLDFVDPSLAYKLVTLDEINYESGEVVGAEEAVKAVAESHPYLIKQPEQPGQTPSPTNPARRGPVGRTDADRAAEYLGLGAGNQFFAGGGVVNPADKG